MEATAIAAALLAIAIKTNKYDYNLSDKKKKTDTSRVVGLKQQQQKHLTFTKSKQVIINDINTNNN